MSSLTNFFVNSPVLAWTLVGLLVIVITLSILKAMQARGGQVIAAQPAPETRTSQDRN